MTDPITDPLDHDNNGARGGSAAAKTARPVWVVTPAAGLHQVEARSVQDVLANGGRRATGRDLSVAGVDPAD